MTAAALAQFAALPALPLGSTSRGALPGAGTGGAARAQELETESEPQGPACFLFLLHMCLLRLPKVMWRLAFWWRKEPHGQVGVGGPALPGVHGSQAPLRGAWVSAQDPAAALAEDLFHLVPASG